MMKSLCKWLDARVVCSRRGHDSTDGSEQSGQSLSESSGQSAKESGQKSQTVSKRDWNASNNHDEEDGSGGKRRRGGKRSEHPESDVQRFACPYFKRNPRKYSRSDHLSRPGVDRNPQAQVRGTAPPLPPPPSPPIKPSQVKKFEC